MKHVVVGTAGHIDHGKTSLVKALTGTDTDRLPEEKARGITSDLGFAFLEEPDGLTIEIVDVPTLDDLTAVDPPFAPTILGLYRGMPHGVEPPPPRPGAPVPPRSIVLYRLNLGRAVRSRDELTAQIKKTLLHEIGHLRGLDEDDLRRRGLD